MHYSVDHIAGQCSEDKLRARLSADLIQLISNKLKELIVGCESNYLIDRVGRLELEVQ